MQHYNYFKFPNIEHLTRDRRIVHCRTVPPMGSGKKDDDEI